MSMGVLIDGKWTDDDETYRKGGAFVRATTAFRAFVTADGSAAFPAEAGRYHLYVARPCPWCHRTMIFRALKKLEDVVSMSMVEPLLLEGGWKFAVPDPIIVERLLHELYTKADPRYTGRVSVPVLWDKKTSTIVMHMNLPKSSACSTVRLPPSPTNARTIIPQYFALRSTRSTHASMRR